MFDKSIIQSLIAQHWALHEPTLLALAGVIKRHAAGVKVHVAQVQQIVEARKARSPIQRRANIPVGVGDADGVINANGLAVDVIHGVALIPVMGVIAKHAGLVNGVSQEQGTSCDVLTRMITGAAGHHRVHTLLLDCYSPGGSVDGIADLAELIFEVRTEGRMRVIAQVNDLCASAAYWLASQCSAIAVNTTGCVGSIGVYSVLMDSSRWFDEIEKTTVHLVKSGAAKGIGVDGLPVTENQLAEVQRSVDAVAEVFIDSVARGRGIRRSQARQLADGRVHIGAEAVAVGLADVVQSFDTTIGELLERAA